MNKHERMFANIFFLIAFITPIMIGIHYGKCKFIPTWIFAIVFGWLPVIFIENRNRFSTLFKNKRLKRISLAWFQLAMAFMLAIESAYLSISSHIHAAGYCVRGVGVITIVAAITFTIEFLLGEKIYNN